MVKKLKYQKLLAFIIIKVIEEVKILQGNLSIVIDDRWTSENVNMIHV